MDSWQIAVLTVAAYVAVVTLVKLMRDHRDRLVKDMRAQIDAERQRQQLENRRKQRQSRTAS